MAEREIGVGPARVLLACRRACAGRLQGAPHLSWRGRSSPLFSYPKPARELRFRSLLQIDRWGRGLCRGVVRVRSIRASPAACNMSITTTMRLLDSVVANPVFDTTYGCLFRFFFFR
jgi:hypothetical protein